MYSLTYLLAVIAISIIIIIVAANYFKLHPFLVLILNCFFVGFATGIDAQKIIQLTSSGFGSILSSIGLIVVLGTIIGVFIERSGALDVISEFVLRIVGSQRSVVAMGVLGAVVSIPVFCDSGFIILSKLSKAIAHRKQLSSASMSLALAAGLYTTHTLIPPTPGPIAVAGNIQLSDQLGFIVITGFMVSIPVLTMSLYLAKRLGPKIEVQSEYEELEHQPLRMRFLWASAPILVPILLITASSFFRLFGSEGLMIDSISFLGSPIVALLIGCLLAMIQILPTVKLQEQSELFKIGLLQAGPIILITGAGGAFGSVLKATALSDLLSSELGGASLAFPGLILMAFLLAAILKTAQGSSTSALVISSAILAPLIPSVGDVSVFQLSLLVMAFGGGAMTVSHANDSYFWVVTQFSGFSMKQGYKGFTMITLAQGLTTLATVFLLYYISSVF